MFRQVPIGRRDRTPPARVGRGGRPRPVCVLAWGAGGRCKGRQTRLCGRGFSQFPRFGGGDRAGPGRALRAKTLRVGEEGWDPRARVGTRGAPRAPVSSSPSLVVPLPETDPAGCWAWATGARPGRLWRLRGTFHAPPPQVPTRRCGRSCRCRPLARKGERWWARAAASLSSTSAPPLPSPPGFGARPEGPAAPPGSRDGVLTGVRWPRLLPRRPPRPVDSALVEGRGNCLRLRSTFCATREVWAGCPPVAVLGGGRVFSARACGGPSWALGRRPTPGLSPPPLVYVGLCRVPALVQPRRPGGTAADPSGLQHPRVAAGAVSGGRDAARGEKDAGLSALRRVRPPVPSPAAQAERGSWSRWPGPACRAWQAFPLSRGSRLPRLPPRKAGAARAGARLRRSPSSSRLRPGGLSRCPDRCGDVTFSRAGPKPRQTRDGHSWRMGPLFSLCPAGPSPLPPARRQAARG